MTELKSTILAKLETLRNFAVAAAVEGTDPRAQALGDFAQRACAAAEEVEPVVLSEIWDFYTVYHELTSLTQSPALKGAYKLAAAAGMGQLKLMTVQSLAETLEKHKGQAHIIPERMPYQYRK